LAPVSHIGIFTTDVNLNITSWNDWLVQATGLSEDSVKGRQLIRVIPEIEKRGLHERFLSVLTDGNVELLSSVFHHYLIRVPLQITSEKFSEMQQRVTIAPLMEEGIIHGTLVTIEDVTKQLESTDRNQLISGLEQLSSPDWQARSDAAMKLSSAGKTIISEVLRKIRYEHRNLSILSSAMKVLALSDTDVSDILIEFLNDDDTELRIYSAQMLAERNTPKVIAALIWALDDKDINVRYHAIESLGKLRAFQAVDRLAEIALSRDFFIAFPAIDALKSIGDNRAFRLIYPLIDDETLGQPVIEALGELGDSDAIPFLAQQINKNSPLMPSITGSMARIAERYQITLHQGAYIADIAKQNLSTEGIRNLLDYFGKAPENSLNAAITVLGWIDDPEVHRALTRFLGHPGTNKKVIDALVSSGKKVTDLLISQLSEETEIRQAAVMALGRIGGENIVEALMPLLKDDELAVICCGAIAKIGDRRAFNSLLDLLGHHNPSIRRAAIAALNSIGHPDMGGRILELLSSNDHLELESAVRIAGYFGFPECAGKIMDLCSASNVNVRIAAIEVLPFFEDSNIIESLKQFISDPEPKIRAAVVKSLGQMEDLQSVSLLEQSLDDLDGWVRYYAIRSLDQQGKSGFIQKIRDVAIHDSMPFVRLAAIEYIGHTSGNESVSVLTSLTGDTDRDVALSAIKALGDINHPDAVPTLLALSKSTDNEIKKWSIESLGKTKGSGVSDALQWIALTEKDPAIRKTALKSLRMEGSKESVRALINLTSDPENRENAISALSTLPAEMIDTISEGLNHRHPVVRIAIVEVLFRIHTPLASARLAECLNHNDVNVRLATIRALHRLGNRSYMKKLHDLKTSDPDPVVRKAAEDIFQSPE
jgi:PAS domain S-box-containing protein